jgi:hypothetical protein
MDPCYRSVTGKGSAVRCAGTKPPERPDARPAGIVGLEAVTVSGNPFVVEAPIEVTAICANATS